MSANTDKAVAGCGCMILIMLFNLALGGLATDYALCCVAGVDVPWWADMAIGLVAGQVVIPAAVVCWILKRCGVPVPFFPRGS